MLFDHISELTSKDLEENVWSVLYGNATNNKKMCISAGHAGPVEVKEVTKETLKCGGQTDDQETNKAKKNPFSVTINFNINSIVFCMCNILCVIFCVEKELKDQ